MTERELLETQLEVEENGNLIIVTVEELLHDLTRFKEEYYCRYNRSFWDRPTWRIMGIASEKKIRSKKIEDKTNELLDDPKFKKNLKSIIEKLI